MNSPRTTTSFVTILLATMTLAASAQSPVNVGFLWHMHQPNYRPGQTILETENSGDFSFSVVDVHNQRGGPYKTWPRDAVQSGLGLPHLGAQVSFSGSLIKNLNDLEAAGVNGGQWNNWKGAYQQAANWQTSEGNSRLDMVNFGFNHPLMPLLDTRDIQMQIKLQKHVHTQTWGANVPFSKGIFPPETAFSSRIIPALVAEGIEWSIVDSIHMERAVENYPHTDSSNLYRPNKADQINPAIPDNQWVQLNSLWAPSKVAAPFAYRPHNVQHVDSATGAISKIVAVPAARYEGNEDGRGGFGALQYEQVMDQYKQFNTDPNHPMFVMLHHDGDNFGGGSDSYYHSNFNSMVNWASNNNDYDVTTVQDYLDRFPVATNDLVHIENGSWAGADNGDPEFKKWLGDPDPSTGWSPDRNSWAVLTAAKNRVFTADDIAPATNLDNIINGTGSATERAWHTLLQAEASDHWYWDGTEVWDSNVTLGSNEAVAHADTVLNSFGGQETTVPSVFVPQRDVYNPGGDEFGTTQPNDFEVWTYAYDVSGLTSVTLKYRVDADGQNPLGSIQNETYAGGGEVGSWITLDMASSDIGPPSGILAPTYRAERYGALIAGLEDSLVDYYVEAIDGNGNVERTDIQHVFVGTADLPNGGSAVTLGPEIPLAGETVTIMYDPADGPLANASSVFLHLGFDDWGNVISPDAAMNWNATASSWDLTVPVLSTASQLDLVFNDGAGTWDNNSGNDWHIAVEGGDPPAGFVMDGVLDPEAVEIATAGGLSLHVAVEGAVLYLATDDAGEVGDVFIYLAESPGALTNANWAKAGQIAQWDAFLADENDNDYEGWSDASAAVEAATGANGGVLEGTINLLEEFGALPEEIYLAVAVYESGDGGELLYTLQLPGTINNDGNLDAGEYLLFALPQQNASADFNNDGFVNTADLDIWLASFSQNAGGDTDDDGDTDGTDFLAWQQQLSGEPVGAGQATSVPEPRTFVLLTCAMAFVGWVKKA